MRPRREPPAGCLGLDFAPLARDIARSVRRLVVLPGPGGDALAAALRSARQARGTGPAVDRFDDFAAAVADVVSDARPGETVLLSPACPHFFRRFYLDGAREIGFRALLRRLTVA